jgi:hypothetical protein
VQTYMDDMDRIRAVLSAAPQTISWWTMPLLALIVLSWFAALAAGWIYLNRRVRRSATAPQTEAPRALAI